MVVIGITDTVMVRVMLCYGHDYGYAYDYVYGYGSGYGYQVVERCWGCEVWIVIMMMVRQG